MTEQRQFGEPSQERSRWRRIVEILDAHGPSSWRSAAGRDSEYIGDEAARTVRGALQGVKELTAALISKDAALEALRRRINKLEMNQPANVRVIYYPRNGVPYVCEHKQPPAEMGGAMTFHVRAQQPERVHVSMPPRYAGKMSELSAPYGNCQPQGEAWSTSALVGELERLFPYVLRTPFQRGVVRAAINKLVAAEKPAPTPPAQPHVDAPVKHADGRVEYPQWESSYTKRVVDQLNEAHNDEEVPYIPSLAAAVQAALALLKDYHQTQHQVYEYRDIARKEAATARTELETWKKRALESVRAFAGLKVSILRQVNAKLDELRKVS